MQRIRHPPALHVPSTPTDVAQAPPVQNALGRHGAAAVTAASQQPPRADVRGAASTGPHAGKPSGATKAKTAKLDARVANAAPQVFVGPVAVVTPTPDVLDKVYSAFCNDSLVGAMGQLKVWRTLDAGMRQAVLQRLGQSKNCEQILARWMQPVEMTTTPSRLQGQAIEALVDEVGPSMPAAFVMAQLAAQNPHFSAFHEHHVLLEKLQDNLQHDTDAALACDLAALFCAALQLPAGHTAPQPGWVHMARWVQAAGALQSNAATDAVFLRLLARITPGDLHTLYDVRYRGSGVLNQAFGVLLAWPGAQKLWAQAPAAWQQALTRKQEVGGLHLAGDWYLRPLSPKARIEHHRNYLRRAADGMVLSAWWVSIHANCLVEVLRDVYTASQKPAETPILDAVASRLLIAPYARIAPLRAFAAEVLMDDVMPLHGQLVALLLRFEPTAHRFERLMLAREHFWIEPNHLLAAAQADPEFTFDYVARHQAAIFNPVLSILAPAQGGSSAERLLRLAQVHARDDVPRLREVVQQGVSLFALWDILLDRTDTDHKARLNKALSSLEQITPDAHHLFGTRMALAEASGLAYLLDRHERGPLDRAFLWHSIASGAGIGDDHAVFEQLHDETPYMLAPLVPKALPLNGVAYPLPFGVLSHLESSVDLRPVASMHDEALALLPTRHRRQALGRLLYMAQIAHRTAADIDRRHDLVVQLIAHPRAHAWPMASVACVLHCLRDDAWGQAATDLVMRLHTAPSPIDMIVSLQIMGTFGQAYLARPEVQYTVSALLRRDSSAERAILVALSDHGASMLNGTAVNEPLFATRAPVYHILRGASDVAVTLQLAAQLTMGAEGPASQTRKKQAAQARRSKITEALLLEHYASVSARLPRMADWERVAGQAALAAARAVLNSRGRQPVADASRSRGAPQPPHVALGLYASRHHARAAQQFYGDVTLPTSLALLRHQGALVQLHHKHPEALQAALDAFVSPAQVYDAVPRLLNAASWAALAGKVAARPDTLTACITYAHNLKRVRQDWHDGFVSLLDSFARGEYLARRQDHDAVVRKAQSAHAGQPQWSRAFYAGASVPIAAKAMRNLVRPARLVDTDDFLLTLYSGSDVVGSCQHLSGNPNLNSGLLSRLQMANKRMIAIVDDQDKIFARAVFYLAEAAIGEACVLFMGPVYAATQADREEVADILMLFAQRRAATLQLPLWSADLPSAGLVAQQRLVDISFASAGLPDYIDGLGLVESRLDMGVFVVSDPDGPSKRAVETADSAR